MKIMLHKCLKWLKISPVEATILNVSLKQNSSHWVSSSFHLTNPYWDTSLLRDHVIPPFYLSPSSTSPLNHLTLAMAAFSNTIPDQWCIPITVRLRTIQHPQLTPEVYLVCNTKAHRVKKFTVITGTSPVGVTDIIKELLGDVVKMSQSLGQFFGKRVTERLYCGGFYQLQLLPTNTLRHVFFCVLSVNLILFFTSSTTYFLFCVISLCFDFES